MAREEDEAVKPLREAPSLGPQKRPTDVHGSLSFSFNSRKSEHVALGEDGRYGFDGCQFWGFSSFGRAPYRLDQCGSQGMCQGQKVPRIEVPSSLWSKRDALTQRALP